MKMAAFEEAWEAASAAHDGQEVSNALKALVHPVYSACIGRPCNLRRLKSSLEELLSYLAGEGRTNANCWAVDLFFMTGEKWEQDWAEQGLPDEFMEVFALMGQALHDTVKAPAIAGNFDCLPEQLLERVRSIPVAN